jgi:hypothetical protein
MPELAELIAAGLRDPDTVADRTSELRQRFDTVRFVRNPNREQGCHR